MMPSVGQMMMAEYIENPNIRATRKGYDKGHLHPQIQDHNNSHFHFHC